jgi:hypothetical protein
MIAHLSKKGFDYLSLRFVSYWMFLIITLVDTERYFKLDIKIFEKVHL